MLYKINLNNFYGDFLIPQSLLEASKRNKRQNGVKHNVIVMATGI